MQESFALIARLATLLTRLTGKDQELGGAVVDEFTEEKGRQVYVLSGLCRGLWWRNADLGSNSLSEQIRKVPGVCPLFAEIIHFKL